MNEQFSTPDPQLSLPKLNPLVHELHVEKWGLVFLKNAQKFKSVNQDTQKTQVIQLMMERLWFKIFLNSLTIIIVIGVAWYSLGISMRLLTHISQCLTWTT